MWRRFAWLLPAVALLATLAHAAQAHPVRPPGDRDLIEPPFEPSPQGPCPSGKTWSQVEKCLAALGVTGEAFELAGVKVVAMPIGTAGSTRLRMYAQRADGWSVTALFVSTGATEELLGISALDTPLGKAVRVDVGTARRTNVLLEPGSATRGILRRVTTTVCLPSSWLCRSVMTSCETYVRGRLLWQFHGDVVARDGTNVRVRGDLRRAGSSCQVSASQLEAE